MELITQQAMKAGFTGGVVIDYPNSTKAKKLASCVLCMYGIFPVINTSHVVYIILFLLYRIFLCLFTAKATSATLPKVRSCIPLVVVLVNGSILYRAWALGLVRMVNLIQYPLLKQGKLFFLTFRSS